MIIMRELLFYSNKLNMNFNDFNDAVKKDIEKIIFCK